DDYLQWIEDVCIEIKRVLKDDGSFFLNIGNKPSDEWMTWSMEGRLKGHFSLLARIIWAKSLSVNKSDVPNNPNITGDISIGQRRPIHSNRFFTNNYEFIDLFTKTKDIELDKLAIGVPYQDKSNTSRWKSTNNKDIRELDKIWFIPYETIQSKSER